MSIKPQETHTHELKLALQLADKEVQHLRYSRDSIKRLKPDLAWVCDLENRPELAEKVEAFVSRFARLQDHLGDKLLPRFAALVGNPTRTLIDTLALAERAEVVPDAQAFMAARRLRNALVHEYMQDPQLFLDSLNEALDGCTLLFETVDRVRAETRRLSGR